MARSPFHFFRKYTGLMMVVLCALLMFAFVVADPLMQMANNTGRGGSGGSDVAVSWNGGQLTEAQLSDLVVRRQVLASFLRQVLSAGYQASVAEGAVNPTPIVQPLDLPATAEQGVEQHVVSTKIYADAAREAGIVVSDEAIRDYLTDLGFRKVSRDDMRSMLRNMGGRGGLNIDFVFELLRDALLARNYDRSYLFTSYTTMPQQRWRDWLRVNDRVVVEAAALRAEDFVSQVADPTDEELEEFFEEYKDAVPTPHRIENVELPSPTPGFATPRRVKLQYAKFELTKLADELIADVTDEEIETYYEENKERFIKSSTMADEGLLEEMTEEEDSGSADSQSEETPSQEADAPSEGGSEGESAADSGVQDSAGPDEPGAGANEPDESGASEEGASKEQDPAEAAESAAPDETDSGATKDARPFRFAAFQDEASDGGDGEAENQQDKPADDSTPEQPAEAEPSADDESPDEVPANEPTAEVAEPEMTPGQLLFGGEADEPSEEDDSDPAPVSGDGTEEEEPVEYQPLDEVRDEIRQTLSEAKAIRAMQGRMTEIAAPLKEVYDEYFLAALDAVEAGQEKPEPPAELLDLESFAEQNDLEYAETAELTYHELRDSSIGLTGDLTRPIVRNGREEPMPLVTAVFGDRGVELYEPTLTYNITVDPRTGRAYPTNGYVILKTSDTPEKKPTLEEARSEVVRAWKLQKAADLALEEAKKIVEEAQGSGLSLKDFLASRPEINVVETDPFSWITAPQASPLARRIPLRLSQPEAIVAPGPEFMEEVFSLGPRELGAVLNHDHSVAYVVRVVQRMMSRDELRNFYLLMGEMQFARYGFEENYSAQITAARIRDLLGDSELDWKRPPDDLRGGGEG